jgi:hypothetical protein
MQVGTASEVAEAYSRYSYGVDNRRAEVIEGCFTPKSSFGLVGQTPIVGGKAIAERLMHLADPAVVHHAFNIVVLGATSDGVVARADFTMAEHGVVFATGHYDDALTKLPDLGWVFSRRAITYTWRASTQ